MLLTFRVILSDRELEVLQLFGKGRSTKSIFRDSKLECEDDRDATRHIKEKPGCQDSEDIGPIFDRVGSFGTQTQR
jgi:hypothetical protein